MKTIAFVPVKLESQRVPAKMLHSLGGRPLVRWIFESLLKTPLVDEVLCYTSDAAALRSLLPKEVWIVPRPSELDGAAVQGPAIYRSFDRALDTLGLVSEVIVLAHATSPFLRPRSIARCISAVRGGWDSACTVRRLQTFLRTTDGPLNYDPTKPARTQDLAPVYAETSGCFCFRRSSLHSGVRYGTRHFPVEVDAKEGLDIDEESDLEFADILCSRTLR